MADIHISRSLRQQVIRRAFGCCEYCVSQIQFSPDPFSIEHITPRVKGGSNDWNTLAIMTLCLSISLVKNYYKLSDTSIVVQILP